MAYQYERVARSVRANMDFAGEFYGAMDRIQSATTKAEQTAEKKLLKEVAYLLTNFDLVLDKKSYVYLERVGSDQRQGWAHLFVAPKKGGGITAEGAKNAIWDVTRIMPKEMKPVTDGWMFTLNF